MLYREYVFATPLTEWVEIDLFRIKVLDSIKKCYNK